VFAEIRTRYPGIAIELITDTRALSLTKREADIALRLAPPRQQDLRVRKLADLGFGIYASQAYLDRHGEPDFTQGAPGHERILVHDELIGTPDMAWFSQLTAGAALALRSNSRFAQRAACAAGLGLACFAPLSG